jgi:hypothetical protein
MRTNKFRHVRREEFDTEEFIKVSSEFNVAVSRRSGDPMNMEERKPEYDVVSVTPEWEVYEDD